MLLIDLVVAFSGLVLSALLLWRHPVATAVTLIAVAVLSDLTGIGESGFQLGVTIYPLDLSCAALIACCIVVSLRTRSLPRDFCWPALILLALGVLNFGRGVLLFGPKAPGNNARELIYLVLPVVAFSFLGPAMRMNAERLINYLSLASLGFAVVAVARWAGVLAMPDVYDEEFREVVRVLPSDYAIVIGQALIGVLGTQLIRGFRTTGLMIAGLFAGLVFALQHRSVWTATVAGIAWLVLRSPRLVWREWLKFSSLTLLLASSLTLTALLASGPLEKALKLFHSNVQEVSQDGSTWAWRVEGYSEAIERVFSNGLTQATLGPPSGRDLSNTASFASIHIHDRYIHTLAYYGLIGLVFLFAWLLSTWMRIQRLALIASRDRRELINKATLEAMLISALVYFVPYSGGQLEGTLLGAIWLASAAHQIQEDGPTPIPGSTTTNFYRRPLVAATVLEKSYGLRSSK